ncbi:MAG: 16S rRNA (cytosine(967)-C(5))-methyltransferase RsmB [Verrucomicrobiae bacterium]|nr:16S rRNA (cytosine(967)-C(5))-methyltransferase RsmB [Verrucomicrobiae bacterium]
MNLAKPRQIALMTLDETSLNEKKIGDGNSELIELQLDKSNKSSGNAVAEKIEFIEDRLEKTFHSFVLSDSDRRLIKELCIGVKKWELTLDWLISKKTKVPPKQHTLANILRLGVYQIIFLTKIPDHAAVNEMVDLTKHVGLKHFVGLVNAVLRAFARERESVRQTLKELKRTQPHIGYSHPKWLFERWCLLFGEQNAIQLLKWNNIPSRTFARVNTLKTTADSLAKQWDSEHVDYKPLTFEWAGKDLIFEIKSHPPLKTLNSLRDGLFYIQDPSTLMAVSLLEPKKGEKILDYCAAPGGKTTFIAQASDNKAIIFAYDSNPLRIKLLEDNLTRLGVQNSHLIKPGEEEKIRENAPYDKILIDAPCSNTGVMRRRIELRWRLKPHKFKWFQKAQLEILSKSSVFLKPGGVLVYSTCSIDREENQDVVNKFLSLSPGFRLDFQKELLPFRDGVDGAFAARLIRQG